MGRNSSQATAGMTLFTGADASTATTQIKGLRKIGRLPLAGKADEYETTEIDQINSDGTIDWDKQFEFGFRDGGSISLVMGYNDANITQIVGLAETDAYYLFKTKSGRTVGFPGRAIDPGLNPQERADIQFEWTIRVIGHIDVGPAV